MDKLPDTGEVHSAFWRRVISHTVLPRQCIRGMGPCRMRSRMG
jgi:hypothetical protein